MIRFLPDTWRETLLRPLAMGAPDAGVYIEIMAPDFRFALAMALALALGVLLLARRGKPPGGLKPVWLLVAFVAAAFVPWLATTANGRYFIPFLLAIGPVCIALIYWLPTTRGFRVALAVGVVGLQLFAIALVPPWQSWGLAQWKEPPYFQVSWPSDLFTHPADYVTLSTISYSLLAPQLPPKSGWINLANAPPPSGDSRAALKTRSFLERSSNLKLLAPVIPDFMDPAGSPIDEAVTVIDSHLADHGLTFKRPVDCRLIPSHGLASMAVRRETLADKERIKKLGFWICPVVLAPAKSKSEEVAPTRFNDVFKAVELQCPRFFPEGPGSRAIPGGELRVYAASEMKLYVLDDGSVFYKYYRALNPVRIGSRTDVLAGTAKVNCTNIQGRSGLPWEREI